MKQMVVIIGKGGTCEVNSINNERVTLRCKIRVDAG